MSFESQIQNMKNIKESVQTAKTPLILIGAIDKYGQKNGQGELIDLKLKALQAQLYELAPDAPLRTKAGALIPMLGNERIRLENAIIEAELYLQSF